MGTLKPVKEMETDSKVVELPPKLVVEPSQPTKASEVTKVKDVTLRSPFIWICCIIVLVIIAVCCCFRCLTGRGLRGSDSVRITEYIDARVPDIENDLLGIDRWGNAKIEQLPIPVKVQKRDTAGFERF